MFFYKQVIKFEGPLHMSGVTSCILKSRCIFIPRYDFFLNQKYDKQVIKFEGPLYMSGVTSCILKSRCILIPWYIFFNQKYDKQIIQEKKNI